MIIKESFGNQSIVMVEETENLFTTSKSGGFRRVRCLDPCPGRARLPEMPVCGASEMISSFKCTAR